MSAILTALLTILQTAAPEISSGTVGTIIAELIKILPTIIQEAPTLLNDVKQVISVLSASPATTADQVAQLEAMSKQVDDAFDEALKKAEAADKAADDAGQ